MTQTTAEDRGAVRQPDERTAEEALVADLYTRSVQHEHGRRRRLRRAKAERQRCREDADGRAVP